MEFTIEGIKEFIDALPNHYIVITYEEQEGLRIVAFSEGMPQILGLTDEEFSGYVGRSASELVVIKDREKVTQTIIEGCRERKPFSHAYRINHKTDGCIWVRVKTSFPGTLEGKALCFASIDSFAIENGAYEGMLNSSVYGICTIDRENGEILYVNQRYSELVGVSVKDCIGKKITEVPESKPELHSKDILNQTLIYRCPEKGRIFDVRGTEVKWGIRNAMAVFISDVTEERKRTMEAAMAAREHLDAIMRINSAAMSTFRVNLTQNTLSDGVSTYPNLIKLQKKNTMDGYVEDALEFLPFEGEQKIFARRFSRKNLLEEYEKGNTQVAMKHHYMLTDKEQRILNTIVAMVENKVTKDIEGIVYTLDVTYETYYSQINEILFNNSNIGITIINVKKSTFIMPQTSSILDFPISYEEQDFQTGVQAIVDSYVVEEDKEYYLQCGCLSNILRHLEQDSRYSFSSRWKKDGKLLNMRLTCYYVDETHEQIIGIAEDVTEITQKEWEQVQRYKEALHQVEEAMKQAEKANHAKSDFLSSMSHDIRTPLNAIVNLTNLLHEELHDPEKLEEDIQKIEMAGEFLLQLINDVLDVAAIESGKLTLVPRVYTYATFLNYIKGIIVPLCENKDIRFILDEGPTALDIYMDRVRFHQVFFNILSNAVKYTPPGGTVTFQTTNNVVHDGILTCDFVVSDTGCGMTKEFIEQAFEPFVREDSQNAYIGTGLGLAICKRIVDLMGGTISIESEVGVGTTVTVHMDLQIATEEQKEASQAEMDTSYHRNVVLQEEEECRILIVEDNAINREIISRLLEKKNYMIECAENGKEAVEKIQTHEGAYYHLVLMDIRMPVMDGLEAAALIRQDPDEKRSHIPIIAITANAFEDDARECLEAGMNAYLAKPISPNALYEMIATYTHTNR